MRSIKVKPNPVSRVYFLLNNRILSSKSFLELIGEGTYIKYAGGSKWAHVKLKIKDNNDSSTPILKISDNLKGFPEIYEYEIVTAIECFINHYQGLTGGQANLNFEILDATYHHFETGRGNFYFAVANAILNAYDVTLHEPNIDAVEKYKSIGSKLDS